MLTFGVSAIPHHTVEVGSEEEEEGRRLFYVGIDYYSIYRIKEKEHLLARPAKLIILYYKTKE